MFTIVLMDVLITGLTCRSHVYMCFLTHYCLTANEAAVGGSETEGDTIPTGTAESHQGHDVRQSGQSELHPPLDYGRCVK